MFNLKEPTEGESICQTDPSASLRKGEAQRGLLLFTTGRKTGKKRTTPLLYLEDGENLVIVASNGGAPRHPAWWLNLEVDSEPQVRVEDRTLRVRAEEAKGEEKRRLWARLVEMYPAYEDYQRRTTREIPVVILRPQRGTSGSNPVG